MNALEALEVVNLAAEKAPLNRQAHVNVMNAYNGLKGWIQQKMVEEAAKTNPLAASIAEAATPSTEETPAAASSEG